jgi:hypothetical protein
MGIVKLVQDKKGKRFLKVGKALVTMPIKKRPLEGPEFSGARIPACGNTHPELATLMSDHPHQPNKPLSSLRD